MNGQKGTAAEAVQALLNAPTWDEVEKVISSQFRVLSHPASDDVFAALIEKYHDDDEALNWIRNVRVLLDDCLEYGISRVSAKPRPLFDEARLRLVERFVFTDYDDASALVTGSPPQLPGDDAFDILDFLERLYRDDARLVARIAERTQILRDCCDVGPEKAFAPYVLTVHEHVAEAVVALLCAAGPTETAELLRARESDLTAPEADALLGFIAETATTGPAELARIPQVRMLLARCRSDGCDVVARELLGQGAAESGDVSRPVNEELGEQLLEEVRLLQERRGGLFPPDVEQLLLRRPELSDAWESMHQGPGLIALPPTDALAHLFERILALPDDPAGVAEKIQLLRAGLDEPVLNHLPAFEGVLRFELGTLLSQVGSGDVSASVEESIEQHRRAADLLEGRDDAAAEKNAAHLAIALTKRRTGDADASTTEAVRLFESLIARSTSTADVARYTSNLAATLLGSPQARRRENVDRARSLLASLGASGDRDLDDADVLFNVANTLVALEGGDHRRNVHEAILCYERALPLLDATSDPDRYGSIRLMMCRALNESWGEERPGSLARIDDLLAEILEVYRPGHYTERWAEAQSWQASRCLDRPGLSDEQRVDQATTCMTTAIENCPRDRFPHDWAKLTVNLGEIVCVSGAGRSTITDAIERLYGTIEIYRRTQFPSRWAHVHHRLGALWAELALREDDPEAAERAREHLDLATTVRTPDQQPVNFMKTQRVLARLAMHVGDFDAAHAALEPACETASTLVDATDTTAGRRQQAAEAWEVFEMDTECLLHLQRPGDAVERLEQGRAQVLRGALTQAGFDARVSHAGDSEIERILRKLSDTASSRELPTPGAHDLEGTAPDGGVFVSVLTTPRGTAVIPLLSGRGLPAVDDCMWLPDLSTTLVDQMLGSAGGRGWLGASSRRSEDPVGWQQTIDTVTADLWELLAGPLSAWLSARGVVVGSEVVLALPGKLARWPIHAAWTTDAGVRRYFLESWTVSYAPSGLVRRVSAERARTSQRRSQGSALLVANPTHDLAWADLEGRAIAGLIGDAVDQLTGDAADDAAVLARMSGKSLVHFACHGHYDWREPFESRLHLAQGTYLSLAAVIAQRNLTDTRLVTLSACETGVVETTYSESEHLGLPAAYLVAGAAGVVSSLWAVQDEMACNVMIEFYRHLLRESRAPAAALREAQLSIIGRQNAPSPQSGTRDGRLPTAVVQPAGGLDWSWAAFTLTGA